MNIKPCRTRCNVFTAIVFSLLLSLFATSPGIAATNTADTSNRSLTAPTVNKALQRWLNKQVNNHPAILAAESALDAAGFQLIAADKAVYNPELEIDAETAETDSASIGLSQTIDWGDTRGARTLVADSQRSAARFQLESTRRRIAAELLTALAELHTSEALQALAEQGNTLMQRSAKLAKQRFDAGDLGKVEVDLANLSYAQARFKLADSISQQARARQNLFALTGSTSQDWPDLLSRFPAPKTTSQDLDKTIQQLPLMQKMAARVKAAQANIKLQAGQTSANPTLAFRAGKEEQDALFGLSLSIPLQVRNNFQAELDVANAEMIQAQRESLSSYRKLKSRLQIAVISYQLSRDAWLAWQQSGADTLNEQIQLLERLWKAGEINTTDYLIQLTQALETKASAIEQRGRMWTDWSEWLIATGKIEQWLLK